MKRLMILLVGFVTLMAAEGNVSTEKNVSAKQLEKKKLEEAIKQQMEREKKYAKEQKFYEGKEYDLKSRQVDPDEIKKVPLIKPEDDFDMSDVYSD